jgi:hypothetical protein
VPVDLKSLDRRTFLSLPVVSVVLPAVAAAMAPEVEARSVPAAPASLHAVDGFRSIAQGCAGCGLVNVCASSLPDLGAEGTVVAHVCSVGFAGGRGLGSLDEAVGLFDQAQKFRAGGGKCEH